MVVLFILITIAGFCLLKDKSDALASFIFILILELGAAGCLIDGIVNERVIDNKIELLEKQNAEIEEKVELTVKTYMNFEKNTLKEFKTDNYIQLINLYPDLKSDKLIQRQITLYENNNEKILALKNQKIEILNFKWWLYFGR